MLVPGTQMTLVLSGRAFFCSNPKIEDKQVPGKYTINDVDDKFDL